MPRRAGRPPPHLTFHVEHSARSHLHVRTEVGTQRERAIIVQLLVTSPTHRIAHSFNLELNSKLQPLPICHGWHHELCLANLARQRITGVQTTAFEYFSVLALHGHS